MTAIEWTDETWNPVTGCDRVSPGCDNCYALKMAARLKAMGQPKYQTDGDPSTSGPGFGLAWHPNALKGPLRRKKPTRYFVNSMSDLGHPDVPYGFTVDVFAHMAASPQHTFQILTKRPQLLAGTVGDVDGAKNFEQLVRIAYELLTQDTTDADGRPPWVWPLPNVWLGTSIETNRYAFRAEYLRDMPSARRFLSLEPLLGSLPSLDLAGIDWVIVGGESGPGARPMHPDWVRDIRDRCVAATIPFFFKQWGAWVSPGQFDTSGWDDVAWNETGSTISLDGEVAHTTAWPGPNDGLEGIWRVGKKKAGRLLDGRSWDETPEDDAV